MARSEHSVRLYSLPKSLGESGQEVVRQLSDLVLLVLRHYSRTILLDQYSVPYYVST